MTEVDAGGVVGSVEGCIADAFGEGPTAAAVAVVAGAGGVGDAGAEGVEGDGDQEVGFLAGFVGEVAGGGGQLDEFDEGVAVAFGR